MYCDVRDVVAAHIAAAETANASGRYMVTHTHSSNPKEVSDMLQVTSMPVMPRAAGLRACRRNSVGPIELVRYASHIPITQLLLHCGRGLSVSRFHRVAQSLPQEHTGDSSACEYLSGMQRTHQTIHGGTAKDCAEPKARGWW